MRGSLRTRVAPEGIRGSSRFTWRTTTGTRPSNSARCTRNMRRRSTSPGPLGDVVPPKRTLRSPFSLPQRGLSVADLGRVVVLQRPLRRCVGRATPLFRAIFDAQRLKVNGMGGLSGSSRARRRHGTTAISRLVTAAVTSHALPKCRPQEFDDLMSRRCPPRRVGRVSSRARACAPAAGMIHAAGHDL